MSSRRPNYDTRRVPTLTPKSPAEALEPTRAPSRPRGNRRLREVRPLGPTLSFINNLLTILVITLAIGGAGAAWIVSELARPSTNTEARGFVVRKGEGVRDVAERLEADGVIVSQHLFVAHYLTSVVNHWMGGEKPFQVKAGEYEIPPQSTMKQVADILDEGKTVLLRVTIPEGLTSHQIVERLKADPSLRGEITAVPPEGTLLPDTYRIPRSLGRQQILELMQAEQRKVVAKAWAGRQTGLPLRSPQEAVILASVIEKETGQNDERTRIAAVFINRLRQGMRLQSDPTILYGLTLGQTSWGRPIYRSEIAQKTAHNTYQIDGLPPTPICNPGRAAIEAAVNPAKRADLFFVADGTGGHIFSATLKEHNAAVAKWRVIEKEMRARQAEAAAKAANRTSGGGEAAPVPPAGAGTPLSTGGMGAELPPEESAAGTATPAPAADATQPGRKTKR